MKYQNTICAWFERRWKNFIYTIKSIQHDNEYIFIIPDQLDIKQVYICKTVKIIHS